ncbi:hypothetical protein EDB89DRAFT_2076656 [Lactarius sanguifluus]|nr:hypothetical protein EDB89DRAFT_2076656 [Lactarius sanguifluus]
MRPGHNGHLYGGSPRGGLHVRLRRFTSSCTRDGRISARRLPGTTASPISNVQRYSLLAQALTCVTAPMHGAHLSEEQVAELVAPYLNTLELVIKGVSVTRANALLEALYELYGHAEE